MSFISPEQTAYKDGPNLDAFGRLRTSVGAQLLGLSQEYTPHPLVWENYSASGGSATHSPTTNSTTLTTGGATAGARALRQLKAYLRYTPGKSQLIKMTGVIRAGGLPSGAAFAGVGYYDDRNGLFFKDTPSGMSVAERSDVSGTVSETVVLQSAWNIDKFDGTGPSGKIIDWTKTQIFVIDLQWLGAGRVRFGLNIDGSLYYCHQRVHANLFPSVYMGTACLPVRYETFNSGGSGASIATNAICSSVESEGGLDDKSVYPFSYSAYIDTPITLDTTLRPLITRRLRDTFNGKTTRGISRLISFGIRAASSDLYWEIRYNQTVTVLGSVITNLVDSANSISEYDTYTGTANTVSDGTLIYNGFAPTGVGAQRGISSAQGTQTMMQLGRTYANTRDTYTLSARAMSSSASASVWVQLEEQY